MCVCVWVSGGGGEGGRGRHLRRVYAMAAGVGMRATRSNLEDVYFFFTACSELLHRMCSLMIPAHTVRSVAL